MIISSLPIKWRPTVEAVCHRHRLGVRDILTRSRRPEVARCRFEAWREIRRTFGSSFAEIGRRFGGYHPTSISHGVNTIESKGN